MRSTTLSRIGLPSSSVQPSAPRAGRFRSRRSSRRRGRALSRHRRAVGRPKATSWLRRTGRVPGRPGQLGPDDPGRGSSSAAVVSAAPSSGGSRNEPAVMPSRSMRVLSVRAACCRASVSSGFSFPRSLRGRVNVRMGRRGTFYRRVPPISISLSTLAMRVSVRTLLYDKSPALTACVDHVESSSARPIRSHSRGCTPRGRAHAPRVSASHRTVELPFARPVEGGDQTERFRTD